MTVNFISWGRVCYCCYSLTSHSAYLSVHWHRLGICYSSPKVQRQHVVSLNLSKTLYRLLFIFEIFILSVVPYTIHSKHTNYFNEQRIA